ncbi:hypothetical protein Y032_0639g993 [Ancylostoma ceylanicum]|nr:hypothetical protein Y032_0639g993 [Ancylostoma ceylanicum]
MGSIKQTTSNEICVVLSQPSRAMSVQYCILYMIRLSIHVSKRAGALAQFGWESNHHREALERMRKKSSVVADIQQAPSPFSSNPQIIVRSPRSRSASEARPPSRQRSNSAGVYKFVESTSRTTPTSSVRLRRTKSSTAVYLAFDPRRIPRRESDDQQPRFERAVTGDSVFTSGLGSLSEDSTEAGRRPAATLDSLVSEWESRSRTSTIAYCLNQGLIGNKNNLIVQGTVADMVRDPHHSNTVREKWKLAPLKTKRTVEVNRNLADPAIYIYMTKDEETSLSRFRHEMLDDPWLKDELLRREMEPTSAVETIQILHFIALPSDIEIISSNIFSTRSVVTVVDQVLSAFASEVADELEDRGARSGHSRSQRTDARITHSAYRCFYCSSKEKGDFVLPQQDVSGLRQEVLNQVDMLEIQQSTPEKKLLLLRSAYPWLFEWPCLYSDVLELLDEYRFKSKSRAFLQEIFYKALRI